MLIFLFGVQYNCFADAVDCLKSVADSEHNNYFEKNKDKQISGEKFEQLDENGQREAKIRNICFGESILWHELCAFKKCEPHLVELDEYCTLANIDCFTDDINTIFSTLQQNHSDYLGLFFADMNDVTNDISNGNLDIAVIDTDNSVCYRTDNNGDTIWHVFIKNNKDIWTWANLCVSVNDNGFDMLSTALYKTKNKEMKTAVQYAIDSKNPDNLFVFLSAYAKQEKKDYCNFLPQDISTTNNVDLKKVKTLLKCE